MSAARIHGGADARGAARWDFSTCANATGPCPQALAAVEQADASRYPDPTAAVVRTRLAELHGVATSRVLLAASASEFIQRFTAVSARLWPGAVRVPRHAYGDYAAAAQAWGLESGPQPDQAALRWYADPSSPLGQDEAPPDDVGAVPTVLDAVYAPLRLQGDSPWQARHADAVFVLHSPNKALGLCGVRGAYAIAPREAPYDLARWCNLLDAAAPSWPLSAHADAMLRSWCEAQVQAWVARSRSTLAAWKAALQQSLMQRGFELRASVTPHFVMQAPPGATATGLREQGVAVRDTTSFSLPGGWRISTQAPAAQQALLEAIDLMVKAHPSKAHR